MGDAKKVQQLTASIIDQFYFHSWICSKKNCNMYVILSYIKLQTNKIRYTRILVNRIWYDLTLPISEREQNDSYCTSKLRVVKITSVFCILKLLARKGKHHHHHFSSPWSTGKDFVFTLIEVALKSLLLFNALRIFLLDQHLIIRHTFTINVHE